MTRVPRPQPSPVRPPASAAEDAACPKMAGTGFSGIQRALRLLPLAGIGGIVLAAYWQGWFGILNLESLVRLHGQFHAMIDAHPVAALAAYCLAYVAVGALCVPGGALLTAAGGLVFGTPVAFIATVIGATAGATLIFLIARSALSDWVMARNVEWFQKLRTGFEKDALHYLLFLRLVPAFPFWFVNIAAAALGVPARTFVFGTLVGIAPASLAFTSAGAGLGSIIASANASYQQCLDAGGTTCKLSIPHEALFTRELLLSLLLLGALALIPIAIKRWRRSHA